MAKSTTPSNGVGEPSTRPLVAMVSGHIDLEPEIFTQHYQARLDAAISRGDRFVLSNAGGADTLCLDYLRARGVDPARITIYMHAPPPSKKMNATMLRINAMRTTPEVAAAYRMEGLGCKVIQGGHTIRDAAMTTDSDYDILWLRDKEDTRKLYGVLYRPDRVSGTEKNMLRRLEKRKMENGAHPLDML